jgi:hypothetical protein
MSLLSIDELRTLAEQRQHPAISLYMPTQRAGSETRQNPIRFKNLIRQVEALLQEQMRDVDAAALLQPAIELDSDNFWQQQDQGLAIFIAHGSMCHYRVPLTFEELVVVSDRFHLKPLMPLLTNDGEFYLLALSQKQIRLFQGNHYGISEIELEGDIPTSVEAALQYDETAKEGQFRISTSKGGTNNSFQHAGTFHGQGSPDRDHPKADILQFFHILDQGLKKYLREPVLLVLAGVEYLLPIYQEANRYSHLVDAILPVENVGVLDPKDVHEQAWALVEPFYTQSQDTAIERYHELAGTGKT